MNEMKTLFATDQITIPLKDEEVTLNIDGNGKVTRDQGDFDHPVANAFSLVQIKDCPFSTAICRNDCYVNRLEFNMPDVHMKYQHNSNEIRKILKMSVEKQQNVVKQFANWISEHCTNFRWHISGDIYCLQYAKFIGDVCREAPEVNFWLYTRSFEYLAPIVGISNLVVNLSADVDNLSQALVAAAKYNLRICYMTIDGILPILPENSVIFPSYQLRGRDLPVPTNSPWWRSLDVIQRKMVCPPDFFGQGEHSRCGVCKKCLKQK